MNAKYQQTTTCPRLALAVECPGIRRKKPPAIRNPQTWLVKNADRQRFTDRIRYRRH